MHGTSQVISLFTATGEILCASASVGTLFGYRPEEVTGRSALEFIHSDDHARWRAVLRTVLASPFTDARIEVRVRSKDGQWCRVDSTIANFLETPRIGALMATSRQAAAIGDASQALPPASETPGVTPQIEDFAHAVAHDLREPLRTISMFTEILTRRTELDTQGKELARNIVDSVKRISALFDGLHALAMGCSDQPRQRVDVSWIVGQVLRDIGHAVTNSGATVTADRLPVVRSCESDLSRVFQNLIMNAIKYRGEVPPRIHISAEAAGNNWIVSVRDNGVGIPAEHRERVFIPFERLSARAIAGVGIGLSICRKIVESMGGAIWVMDSSGPGATVCFTIPGAVEDLHPVNGNRYTVPSPAVAPAAD